MPRSLLAPTAAQRNDLLDRISADFLHCETIAAYTRKRPRDRRARRPLRAGRAEIAANLQDLFDIWMPLTRVAPSLFVAYAPVLEKDPSGIPTPEAIRTRRLLRWPPGRARRSLSSFWRRR